MRMIDKKSIERAARMYGSNRDAAQALGIAPGSFGRLCSRFGILTPQSRRRKDHERIRAAFRRAGRAGHGGRKTQLPHRRPE